LDARRKDQRFRRLLADNLARHQRLLDLLRASPPPNYVVATTTHT
jgi:hypothetical protein